jgi:hypothetical protein
VFPASCTNLASQEPDCNKKMNRMPPTLLFYTRYSEACTKDISVPNHRPVNHLYFLAL